LGFSCLKRCAIFRKQKKMHVKQIESYRKKIKKYTDYKSAKSGLSTVQDADQIVVLSKGSVVEQGTHLELINKKNHYHTLVKNQLNI
jgi:ABC-type transport system involved in Fe-S cluster assembly fused permease/ATPase subunit